MSRRAASSMPVSSVTEMTRGLMMSRATFPFLEKTSVSETMPTTWPSLATTGAPVIRLAISVDAISSTGVSSRNEMTFLVITSLTGIIAGSRRAEQCSHGLEVGVAAAEDQTRAPAGQLAGQVGGEWKRAGRPERRMEAWPRDLDGRAGLGFRHGDDLVHPPVNE